MNSAIQYTVQNLFSQRKQRVIDSEPGRQWQTSGQKLLIQPGELYHPAPGYAILQVLEGRAWVTHSGLDMLLVTGEQMELSAYDTGLSIAPLSNRPVRVLLR